MDQGHDDYPEDDEPQIESSGIPASLAGISMPESVKKSFQTGHQKPTQTKSRSLAQGIQDDTGIEINLPGSLDVKTSSLPKPKQSK